MVSRGRSPVPLDKCPEWDDAGPLSIFVKTDGGISTCRWLCQFKFFIELGRAGFMDDKAHMFLLSPFLICSSLFLGNTGWAVVHTYVVLFQFLFSSCRLIACQFLLCIDVYSRNE